MLEDIHLGDPTDAVLDSESLRVVGLEIACDDGVRRFLPLAAARLREDHVAVGSALLLLLEEDVRGFYRRRTLMFTALVGAPVQRAGRLLGQLSDLTVATDGEAEAVWVSLNGSGERAHARAGIVVGPAHRVPAA
jgi:hypothetical protein